MSSSSSPAPMVRIGAHLSIAGGFARALDRARRLRCPTLQIFTRAPSVWRARPIAPAEAEEFRALAGRLGIEPVIAHAPYLLNLASPDPALHRRSLAALIEEQERCRQLGIETLVLHPGAHIGSGPGAGLAQVAAALEQAARATGGAVEVALEGTAGGGTILGSRFEELAEILGRAGPPARLAVCLDTAHLHAAGYELRSAEGHAATWAEFERLIGFERLRVIHANDSLAPFGGRRDRHTHVGRGELGAAAFARLLRDPRFAHLPFILETPKNDDPDDLRLDRRNLTALRRLARGAPPSRNSTGRGCRAPR